MDWEHFCDYLFTVNEDTKQDLTWICKAGKIDKDSNTYTVLLTRQAHTQTHTQIKINPEFFIGPSQPWRDKLGVRVR